MRPLRKSPIVSGGLDAPAPLDDTRISERDHRERSLAKTSAGDHREQPRERTTATDARWKRQARAAAREPWFPGHVRACANNPQREDRWTLAVWPKMRPEEHTRIAYTCASYRCPSPECQQAAAHRDFAKLHEAVSGVKGERDWCLLVLTIDQNETLSKRASGGGWKDEQEAFKALSRMSRNFLARLKRWHERNGWQQFKNRWVATVEVQRNGWPHLNIMIHSPGLAAWLEERGTSQLSGELRDHAVASDWGSVGYAERARSRDGLAGYITKLAGDHGRRVGEIAKLTQAPTNARMKLRRIRAGKGFIRAKEKDPKWTGIMLRRKRLLGSHLTYVEPLMKPDQVRCSEEEQPNYLAGASAAIRAEQWQADDESRGAKERLLVSASEETELARWGAYFERLANHEPSKENEDRKVRPLRMGTSESGRDVRGLSRGRNEKPLPPNLPSVRTFAPRGVGTSERHG